MSNIKTELIEAANKGNFETVKNLLTNQAKVDQQDEYGSTALNIAAGKGNLEIVKLLVENGANIENKGGADLTPLMNASVSGHIKTVHYLIEKGATVTYDILSSIQMKVNILEENCESGMVLPEAVRAWQQFLDYLIAERQKQDAK
jgi:ankyrin repeat protein